MGHIEMFHARVQSMCPQWETFGHGHLKNSSNNSENILFLNRNQRYSSYSMENVSALNNLWTESMHARTHFSYNMEIILGLNHILLHGDTYTYIKQTKYTDIYTDIFLILWFIFQFIQIGLDAWYYISNVNSICYTSYIPTHPWFMFLFV